jgi:hypothetical protein
MTEQWQLFGRLCGAVIHGIHTKNMETLETIHVRTEGGQWLEITGIMRVEEKA